MWCWHQVIYNRADKHVHQQAAGITPLQGCDAHVITSDCLQIIAAGMQSANITLSNVTDRPHYVCVYHCGIRHVVAKLL